MEERARTLLHVCLDPKLAGSRRRMATAMGYDIVWVQSGGAALFEISMGRCGILLLCHLPEAVRASLTSYFHAQCPDPYIVVAHEKPMRRLPMRASFIHQITQDWPRFCSNV